MKPSEQVREYWRIADYDELADEVAKLESAIEACRLYLKTGTPFAKAALVRALEELE